MIEFIRYMAGGEWQEFKDFTTTRKHALDLFANNIEVIAKEDGTYICNRDKRRKMYRKAGNRAVMFESLAPVDQPLSIVGFQGGA